MNVALCNDNALGKLYLAAGTNQLAGTRACNVAALSDRSSNADRTSIGSGKLNLVCASYGTEDRNVCERLLRTNDLDSFLTGKLTGL